MTPNAAWSGCISPCCSKHEVWVFFGRGSGRVFCLIQLTSVKRRQVPKGLYKRGTFAWTVPGGLQSWQGLSRLANALQPESSCPSPSWCSLDQRPPQQGGVSVHLGRWFSRLGMRLRNLFHKDSWWFQWENDADSHCSVVLWNWKWCGPCIISSGSFVSFLGCLSYPQSTYSHVPHSISVNNGLNLSWGSLKACNAAEKFL